MKSLLETIQNADKNYFQGKINILKKDNLEFLANFQIYQKKLNIFNLNKIIYLCLENEVKYVYEPEIVTKFNLEFEEFEKIYHKTINFYKSILELRPNPDWIFINKSKTTHPFLDLVTKYKKTDLIYKNSPYSIFKTTELFIFFKSKDMIVNILDGHKYS